MSTQPVQKSVIYAPIGYKMNLKRAMVNSLKFAFNKNHPDTTMKNLYISMEWAERPQQFPAMLVSYQEKRLSNAGAGHMEYVEGTLTKRWSYEGTISVVVFAETTVQRDFITDQFVNMFAFGGLDPDSSIFMRYFNENKGLDAQVMSDELFPLAESSQKGTSWGVEDMTLYSAGYSFNVYGTFHSAQRRHGYIRAVHEQASIVNR